MRLLVRVAKNELVLGLVRTQSNLIRVPLLACSFGHIFDIASQNFTKRCGMDFAFTIWTATNIFIRQIVGVNGEIEAFGLSSFVIIIKSNPISSDVDLDCFIDFSRPDFAPERRFGIASDLLNFVKFEVCWYKRRGSLL